MRADVFVWVYTLYIYVCVCVCVYTPLTEHFSNDK